MGWFTFRNEAINLVSGPANKPWGFEVVDKTTGKPASWVPDFSHRSELMRQGRDPDAKPKSKAKFKFSK